MFRKIICCIFCFLLLVSALTAQDRDIRERFHREPGFGEPNFGIYHDNYFITGIPTDRRIDKNTANAKFQISIRQILFKDLLPHDIMFMLTYTQKSFWDIYRTSFPFTDNNYNPGLCAVMPVTQDGRLISNIVVGFEHESNGRDSIESRSINYFFISGSYYYDHFSAQVKLWSGWIDKEGNPNYFRYKGYGLIAVNYRTANDRFRFSAAVNPRDSFRAFNTQLEASLQLRKYTNQYTFIQWYQGCAEGMLNYTQYNSMVRVGICIKPAFFNHY